MRETKIYCDHCGKVLDEMHDYIDQEISFQEYETADLCKECLHKLDVIVKAFCKKGGKQNENA